MVLFLLQESLGASKFKYVGLPDYELNKNVFEKSNAMGGLAYTSTSHHATLKMSGTWRIGY